MKLSGNQSIFRGARFFATALIVSTLAFASSAALAAGKDAHEDRAELRVKAMHTKLKITPAQEEQWAKVAEAMRNDAKTMDTLTQARADQKDMTAVDALQSYGEITQAHADGVKKLIPAFSDLYATMSDDQKKTADTLFRHGDHKHGHKSPKGNK